METGKEMRDIFTTYRPAETEEQDIIQDITLPEIPKWNISIPDPVPPPIRPEWDEPEFYEPAPVQETPAVKKEESLADRLVSLARTFVGGKYRWGGTRPETGFDCSGLMQYIFGQNGIELPRTAMQQGKVGEAVTLDQARPGDIIWFGSKGSPSGQHIGLISGIDSDGFHIIDAAGKSLGITERLLPDMQIKSIRRVTESIRPAHRIIQYFMNKGLTENQARGIYGNLMQESGGNPDITNSRSGAYGLAQWLGSRKRRLTDTYGSNPSEREQLDFIWHELNTTERKALDGLLDTETVTDATRAFATLFERAGKNEMNMNKRIKYATQA